MSMVSLKSLTTTWAARLVAAFDASGVHRVGTPGDLASGAWFAAEAAQSGVPIARLPVPIQCTRVEEAYLACAGLRIDGLPMFDAPACAASPARLCGRWPGRHRLRSLSTPCCVDQGPAPGTACGVLPRMPPWW